MSKKTHFINVSYVDGSLPISYTLRQQKLRSLPLEVKEHKGIPIYVSKTFQIPSGTQVIHNTGLEVTPPLGIHREIFGIINPSPKAPTIAPGIVLPLFKELTVLLGNLTKDPIKVRKHQLLGFLRLEEHRQVQSVTPLGDFQDIGLSNASVYSAITKTQLDGLLDRQLDKALKLFRKYKDIFSTDDYDLGMAKDVQHQLDVQGHDPIRSRPFRRSQANIKIVDEELQKLLNHGLLIPSKSPWASPVLIFKKKDGTNRVVINYRRLNSITKKDSYPLPQIDDTLDRLGGAKYFSAMDLISGYWQIDLPPSEQEKCAIITEKGLYQPTCMPQGLANAPATFQRAMDSVLGDLKLSCVLVYLDDINVFSQTFEDHLEHLEAVFKRLISANLKLKPRKCNFFKV